MRGRRRNERGREVGGRGKVEGEGEGERRWRGRGREREGGGGGSTLLRCSHPASRVGYSTVAHLFIVERYSSKATSSETTLVHVGFCTDTHTYILTHTHTYSHTQYINHNIDVHRYRPAYTYTVCISLQVHTSTHIYTHSRNMLQQAPPLAQHTWNRFIW